MGHDKPNWEDIPSLDGLEIDWGFEPESKEGKRSYSRLTMSDISLLFKKKDIPVKLVSEKGQCVAFLVDVSQGGICLRTKEVDVQDSQLVKLGFFLGNQKVISKGRVKHVRKENEWKILGIEFVGLTGESYHYIAGLYSSLTLRNDG